MNTNEPISSKKVENLGSAFHEMLKEKIAKEKARLSDSKRKRFNDGYRTILTKIHLNLKDGLFKARDDLEPIEIDQCLISSQGGQTMSNPEKLRKFLAIDGNLQELFGFSDLIMQHFTAIGNQVLSEKKFTDAVNIFTFLSSLNPKVPAYWIGLGHAFESEENFQEAHDAYEMAIITNPQDIESYHFMIRCSQALHNFEEVSELLKAAAKDESMKESAEKALAFIEEQKKTHHKEAA